MSGWPHTCSEDDPCASCQEWGARIAGARAQGWEAFRAAAVKRLNEFAVHDIDEAIEAILALPPDPMPGERIEVPPAGPVPGQSFDEWAATLPVLDESALSKPTARCDTDRGPCACGAWHGWRP